MVEVPAAASMGSVSVSMAIVLDGIDLQRGPTNEIHNRQLRMAPEHAHIYRADSDSSGAPVGFVRTPYKGSLLIPVPVFIQEASSPTTLPWLNMFWPLRNIRSPVPAARNSPVQRGLHL